MEYFNVAKSIWTIVFDSLDMVIKRNKKNVLHQKGFFYYIDNEKKYYVWEYIMKKETKQNPQQMIKIELIYDNLINDLTISKIINKFSSFDSIDKKMGPIFYMISSGIFPIQETLLPMFKRRIAGHISQTKKYEQVMQNKNGIQ
jgi:hypothetical protein